MKLIIYGTNTIREAVVSGVLSGNIFISEKKRKNGSIDRDLLNLLNQKNIAVQEKRDEVFLKEFGKEAFIKGIASEIDYKEKQFEDLPEKEIKTGAFPFYLILDEITDPQNLGSIIRTANCFGVTGIIVPKTNSIFITPSVANVSQGALFYTDVVRVVNIARVMEDLKKRGIWVIGLSNEASEDIYSMDLNIPLAIVVGSEGHGLRRLTTSKCEKILRIPMIGKVNSLNASVSFAIAAYEVLRQRTAGQKLHK